MTTRNGTRNGRATPKKTLAPVGPIEVAPPVPTAPQGTLRLLKVALQPVLVLIRDDGEVQEVKVDAFEIKGADWSEWAATAFTPDALETLRKQIVPT